MLTGVLQIGEYIYKNRDRTTGELDDIIESPNDNGRYNHVFKVVFEKNGEGIKFKGINYEQFSESRIMKYAYKRGSGARGGDRTPTSKLTEPVKTVSKIKSSLKDIVEGTVQKDDEFNLFKGILNIYSTEEANISECLDEKVKSTALPKGEAGVITVGVFDNGKELYMGDFDIVRKHLLRISEEQYFNKYGKISKGTGVCCYCKKTTEVYGFVSTYKSYTLDKVGFVSGGFKQENAWINYPVCGDCARLLEIGKKYIEANLTSKFSGFDYSIIPKLSFNSLENRDDIRYIMERFEKGKFSTTGTTKDNLLNSEANFLDVMKESNNNMNYNMLIFREEQAGNVFRILLYIEDIVPSKLKKLLKVKDEIDGIALFKGLPGKDNTRYDLHYSFDKLRYFFPNSKIEGNFDKNFLELLNNIFSFRKVSYKFLLNRMINKIRELFVREEYYDVAVLQALMNIMFLSKLDLLDKEKKEVGGMTVERTEKNAVFVDFVDRYSQILDSDYKKAVFLEGVLVDKLLNIQYKDRGSKPFYSRLNGLKLNEKLVKRIFTEAVNKLNEYDKNYYKELESIIGMYMLSPNGLTDDEISYFFVLGMILSKKFAGEKKDEEGEDQK